MTITNKPESSLIEQLTQVREALTAERESLLERVATIDQALGAVPSAKPAQKPVKGPNNVRTPKATGIREAVLATLAGNPASTIKQIQELVPEHSPKSVESVVHALVGTGNVTKDGSTPRKFSLAAIPEQKAKTNGAPKAAGASA